MSKMAGPANRPDERATTDCVVVGGGPAGMMLGLLLGRAGVRVTVLEKHADFLRDFRGDTVHPSTLNLLDELGLGEQFAALPSRANMRRLSFNIGGEMVQPVALDTLPEPYNYIAMVPQWDFLNLLAEDASTEPTFTLRQNTEVTGLRRDAAGRVTGVTYRTADGETGEISAALTVACDGRHSVTRTESGLSPREFDCPMDTWWFRLPRNPDEADDGGALMLGDGHIFVLLNRGDYWQVAYLFKKGDDRRRRSEPIENFQQIIAENIPMVADRVDQIRSWDDVRFLDVRLNRLRRWYTDGLLCIGDAAHAMSPAGGLGINLAVQDAVAAARVLAPAFQRGRITTADLAKIQARRRYPTVVMQLVQMLLHRAIFRPTINGEPVRRPLSVMRMVGRSRALRRIPARIMGFGPRPEHAPTYARRKPASHQPTAAKPATKSHTKPTATVG